jgi:hypothetical protein|tara:strand:+ start:1142 stop:1672 length:531 start_codon:yes stop_codon:yes gene_type:complete
MGNKKRFSVSDDIVVYTPTSDDVGLAHKRSCEMGILPGSYMRGMGRMTGCLGEIAVKTFLPRSRFVGNKIYDYDITYKKQKIEVKSKSCGGIPKPEYNAFVNCKENFEFKNDFFFFTRVKRDFSFVYIVGWIPTKTFLKESSFVKRGESDDSGFVYKSSGRCINISDLNFAKDFIH